MAAKSNFAVGERIEHLTFVEYAGTHNGRPSGYFRCDLCDSDAPPHIIPLFRAKRTRDGKKDGAKACRVHSDRRIPGIAASALHVLEENTTPTQAAMELDCHRNTISKHIHKLIKCDLIEAKQLSAPLNWEQVRHWILRLRIVVGDTRGGDMYSPSRFRQL
jgi:hypothetical protein